uniref:Bm1076 n=1 Tax=Brugia malayi TaxID=6279 RepID=A0A0J9Y6L1_BRUMA|nr:Bm1076 [Brugia malayi]
MNCELNDMLSLNSNLSEMKSTIGTSSLSSELTILSFADITVSSQESFDNDNITLSTKNYPTITKLSSTMINILPQNIINIALSHIPLSIAFDKAQIPSKVSINEQIRSKSKTDDYNPTKIQSKNIVKRKNSRENMQKYYKTTSKKIFVFDAFPEETFRNNNENVNKEDNINDTIIQWLKCTQSQTERICNFDKMIELIESIEQEISAIESVCLQKQLHIEELASGESLQIVNKKNRVIEVNEMKPTNIQ